MVNLFLTKLLIIKKKKMKYIYILSFLFIANLSIAQNSVNDDFNKWSVEGNVGISKGVRPFTTGYFSSNPKDYFNFTSVNHYDLGFRYMFNQYFGAKIDLSYDLFQNEEESGSLPFEAQMYGVSLQGVINLGRVLHFNTFTKRFGLLVHGGVKISQFTPKTGGFKEVTEDNGGVVFGVTPQFRLTNRFVLTADFSSLSNMRQHFNWDGEALSNRDNNLTGLMNTVSLGLTYYIGRKADVHADWHSNEVTQQNQNDKTEKEELLNRIDELEAKLSDVDKDGVPDYLDFENNTPGGVAVDSRGRIIDKNMNGISDEMEPNNGNININNTQTKSGDTNVMKSLADNGFLNIYFELNKDVADGSSTTALYSLYTYMIANSDVKISLKGYADVRGGANLNKELSERRAKFVHDFLVKNGISSSRISFIGNGVENVVVSGDKNIDYRLSRRVSVFIVD